MEQDILPSIMYVSIEILYIGLSHKSAAHMAIYSIVSKQVWFKTVLEFLLHRSECNSKCNGRLFHEDVQYMRMHDELELKCGSAASVYLHGWQSAKIADPVNLKL